jgi:hypothetical protein
MYRSFEVSNFRCFRNLAIRDIGRINLIAGVNNVGKTALLEALYIHSGAYNPELVMRVDVFRGIERKKIEFLQWTQPPWNDIFNGFDTTKTIEFVGEYWDGKRSSLRLRAIRNPKELTELYLNLSKPSQKQDGLPSDSNLSSGAHVLELDCVDETQRRMKYNYIFDRVGYRVFPVPPTVPYQVVFMPARLRSIAEDVQRFSALQTAKKQDTLLKALRVVEPRL